MFCFTASQVDPVHAFAYAPHSPPHAPAFTLASLPDAAPPPHTPNARIVTRTVPHTTQAKDAIFEKGQSKRIWGELYKVLDSSDVVIQVRCQQQPATASGATHAPGVLHMSLQQTVHTLQALW